MGKFVIEKANGEDKFIDRCKRARALQSKRKMVSLQRTVATTVGNAKTYVDGWHENGSNMRVVSYGRGPGKLQKPKDKNAGMDRLWAAKARHEKRIAAAQENSKVVVEKGGGPAKTAYTKLGHQEKELSKACVQERQIAFAKELIKRKERSKDRNSRSYTSELDVTAPKFWGNHGLKWGPKPTFTNLPTLSKREANELKRATVERVTQSQEVFKDRLERGRDLECKRDLIQRQRALSKYGLDAASFLVDGWRNHSGLRVVAYGGAPARIPKAQQLRGEDKVRHAARETESALRFAAKKLQRVSCRYCGKWFDTVMKQTQAERMEQIRTHHFVCAQAQGSGYFTTADLPFPY